MENTININVKKEDNRAILPEYTHDGDACMDLRVLCPIGSENYSIVLLAGKSLIFDTGLKFDIPKGHVMMLYPRSGLSIKNKITLTNLTGIIDSNFTETVKVALTNNSEEDFYIKHNDRVAQFNIVPYPKMILKEVNKITDSGRGDGLGSSGVE